MITGLVGKAAATLVGLTVAGTAAELAGALAIAATAYALDLSSFVPVLAGGFAGALVDSLLGGTAQALRWCPQCGHECENEPHACGANTRLVRGFAWIGTDTVNFACSLTGAACAFALAR